MVVAVFHYVDIITHTHIQFHAKHAARKKKLNSGTNSELILSRHQKWTIYRSLYGKYLEKTRAKIKTTNTTTTKKSIAVILMIYWHWFYYFVFAGKRSRKNYKYRIYEKFASPYTVCIENVVLGSPTIK